MNPLFEQLKARLQGDLYTDPLYCSMYSTDASNYQLRPLGVLCPATVADVQLAVKVCARQGIPLISRGGGTSVSGQSIGRGLVVDYSKYMHQLLEMDEQGKWVKVQPGMGLQRLNELLAPKGRMIGPDPASALVATIGGMTANNSTGTHSIVYGMMADHVLAVEVVLANGELLTFERKSAAQIDALLQSPGLEAHLYRHVRELLQTYAADIEHHYPRTWRNVSGYNLQRLYRQWQQDGSLNLATLMVGSEGTLGTLVSITLKTMPKPRLTCLALVHFEQQMAGCRAIPAILQTAPSAIEISNDYFHEIVQKNALFAQLQRNFIKGQPEVVLMVEYSGDTEAELDAALQRLHKQLNTIGHQGEVVLRRRPEEIAQVWQMRKAGFGLMMSQRGDAKPLTFADDATVPIEHLADYMADLNGIFEAANIRVAVIGHASAGCIHINPNLNLKTDAGLARMQQMAVAIAETAMKYGGTITGEHGDGLSKTHFTRQLYGERLYEAFNKVKQLFDPHNLMQPGRIVEPDSLPWDPAILRFYPGYQTPHAPAHTTLDFSADGGFAGLVEMCNGMGFCRKDDGVMCPSYQITRDERHAPRGRANALRAAIKGELPGGLHNPELYESLDLCLECKGCKSECPSMVDIAKLKYEYLAQYQARHGLPLRSRLFAHIHRINRHARAVRGLANFAFANPLSRRLLEWATGIDARRRLPPLAKQSFQQWFDARPRPQGPAPQREVVLWDDTYLSFNYPHIGQAAVQVLEAAGFGVRLLKKRHCCGRPMISKGLLQSARKQAAANVALLLPFARQGVPIIGLEPSCTATFKDEYPDLLPGGEARSVAQQVYFFEDFLVQGMQAGELALPFKASLSPQKLLFHAHCYQKALGKPLHTRRLLEMIPGAEVEEIHSGCCGMAGSFGYEKKHYNLSMACGEAALFPAVRQATPGTRIVAAGISCRHQIADGTGVEALHPAEVLAEALQLPVLIPAGNAGPSP